MYSIIPRKKMLKMIFILLTLVCACSISAYASMTMDGVVGETDWNYWFEDDSDSPIVDVYWFNDSTNVYIGILTEDTTDNEDTVEFAYRASRRDYWFKLKSDGSAWYRSSGGSYEGYWTGIETGLPPGANAVASMTDGNRSYEISISLLSMEEKANNFPDNFVFWYKVQDGGPDGPTNFYPDSRAGWWFVVEAYEEEEEFIPKFSVPELPLGTIMVLVSMFAAVAIFAKKSSFLQLLK